jgi:two-component system response regulator MprA
MADVAGGKGRRALVVEDDGAIASVVRLALTVEGFAVEVVPDGRAGLAAASPDPPDLVVLDWLLPGLDGLTVCRELRRRGDPAIVMVTARDEVHNRVAGLEAGADDYLIKPFHVDELIARVRAVMRRRRSGQSDLLESGPLSLDRATRSVTMAGQPIELTPREFELLAVLLEEPRRVFTKAQLLKAVWGYDYPGDENIVEVYVGYLRAKLGDRSPNGVIRTMRGVGYALNLS